MDVEVDMGPASKMQENRRKFRDVGEGVGNGSRYTPGGIRSPMVLGKREGTAALGGTQRDGAGWDRA
jgi:hypothetical protein